MKRSAYLTMLCENPDFQTAMREIAKFAPNVPRHDPDNDNTEKWKAKSAELKGFNYCLSLIGYKPE